MHSFVDNPGHDFVSQGLLLSAQRIDSRGVRGIYASFSWPLFISICAAWHSLLGKHRAVKVNRPSPVSPHRRCSSPRTLCLSWRWICLGTRRSRGRTRSSKWLGILQSRVPGSVVLLVGTDGDCFESVEERAKVDLNHARWATCTSFKGVHGTTPARAVCLIFAFCLCGYYGAARRNSLATTA